MGHAMLSPSSAHRWMRCPGSVVLEARCPDVAGEFADEGSAAHELSAQALKGLDPQTALGSVIYIGARPITVDQDMVDAVTSYVAYVRSLGGMLLVEQRLPIADITGEPGAHGTADAVVFAPKQLVVVDLKYGRGVRVDAPDNEQLEIYALAAAAEYEAVSDYDTVRTVIFQPRLGHVSEAVYTVDELLLRHADILARAVKATQALAFYTVHNGLQEEHLVPGETQCRFCRAKAVCPAIAKYAVETVAGDFVDTTVAVQPQLETGLQRTYDNDTLARMLAAVPVIEEWCRAVRAQIESELLAGRPVPGYKLVEGRRGARAWADPDAAEAMLKAMRLKVEQRYELKLISPTKAEALVGKAIGDRQWVKLQAMITQPPGKPSVAPESDKRPALTLAASASEFDDEEAGLV